MTDATFLTLFAFSVCLLMPSYSKLGDGRSPVDDDRHAPHPILGTLFAVAATLTRYQGILLAVPITWEIFSRLRRRQPAAALLLAQSVWLLVPAWMFRGGFAHLEQILNRSGAGMGLSTAQTLVAYLNLAECYFYLLPFSLTPPIFFAFLAGLFAARKISVSRGWLVAAFLWSLAFLLAAQAAFGIFEFRYLLPLAAFVLPFAGVGMARLDRALANRRALASPLYAFALAIPMLFGLASLILQREAFADIKEATIFAAEAAGPGVLLYSNEHYNDKIPVAKSSFWAKREVPEDPGSLQYKHWRYWNSHHPNEPLPADLTAPLKYHAGDVLILSDVYAGGREMLAGCVSYLRSRWKLEILREFHSSIRPVLPDLMAVPGAHGSPLWWVFRYQRQDFLTIVIRIEGPAA